VLPRTCPSKAPLRTWSTHHYLLLQLISTRRATHSMGLGFFSRTHIVSDQLWWRAIHSTSLNILAYLIPINSQWEAGLIPSGVLSENHTFLLIWVTVSKPCQSLAYKVLLPSLPPSSHDLPLCVSVCLRCPLLQARDLRPTLRPELSNLKIIHFCKKFMRS
jgi:hypothetical protein